MAGTTGGTDDRRRQEAAPDAAAASRGGRSDDLIDALVAIADDLDVGATLRRTVRTARLVVGARFGALGVLDEDGSRLAQFIHDGLDEETADAIGDLPTGRGLLGAVIREPAPLRVDDVTDHPSSVPLPGAHPPIESFLGVPVRVGGEVFGNLYLAEKQGGFTEEDERTLIALATVAGTAIRNAGVATRLESRELLQRALAELATAVLAGATIDELLLTIATTATGLLPGSTARLLDPDDDHEGASDPDTWHRHVGDGAAARVLAVEVGDVSPWRRTAAAATALTTLCDQAGVALRYADARAEVRRLAISSERDRIARDLHDTVIQRLFGAGLQLDALTRRTDETTAAALERAIAEVDEAIGELRSTIARLDTPPPLDLDDQLAAVVGAMAPASPGLTGLVVEGDLADVPATIAEDLPAVLREGIANATRHADATSIVPRIRITPTCVEVTVDDDGVGPNGARSRTTAAPAASGPAAGGADPSRTTPRRSRDRSRTSLGLRNLAARAARHGGECVLEPVSPRGSRLVWRATRGS